MVSQSCNMRCIYCYGHDGEYDNPGMMSQDIAFRTVDWLVDQSRDVKKLTITFFGGEPLLNLPLIKDVVEYTERKRAESGKVFGLGISSNMALLDEGCIEYFKKHKLKILAGFDGPPAIQNRNRMLAGGRVSFDIVSENIANAALHLQNDVRVRSTIRYGKELPDVVNFLYDFCNLNFVTTFVSPSLHKSECSSDDSPVISEECHEFLLRKVLDLAGEIKQKRLKEVRNLLRWQELKNLLDFLNISLATRPPCKMGVNMAGISVTGDIYPCHRFVGLQDYRVGNILDGELHRELYLEKPMFHQEPCSSCWARLLCSGGCLHDNLGKTGSLFKPGEDYCRWIKSKIELGIYLRHEFSDKEKDDLVKENVLSPKACIFDL